MKSPRMILLIDNYDSFVFNLARYFERLGHATHVVRNDAMDVAAIAALAPAAIVLSPGPCTPSEGGCSLDVVRRLSGHVPILGICLGHQAIGAALGARIVRAVEPVHGRASQIFHDGQSVFAGLESPIVAARYHSLVIERASLPPELAVTAWTADGTIMAIAHRELPLVGLQFHPESILTHAGYDLLAAFLRLADISVTADVPRIDDERAEPLIATPPLPTAPVTF
jgi:anthranilate synthase/aminodeoxychorismate synthase-like glutamine amidotransferase